MESSNYADYSLQQLYDLYNSLDKQKYPVDAQMIYEQILAKEKIQKESGLVYNSASRGARLGAAIIDGIILLTPVFIILFAIFGFSGWFTNYRAGGLTQSLLFAAGAQALYLAINGYLLYSKGQTVGKNLVHIKIVNLQNELPPFYMIYGVRFLVPAIIGAIPIFGGLFSLVDVLFIFGKEKRCVHDYMAGTRVVKA